jgi:hypothetical protein
MKMIKGRENKVTSIASLKASYGLSLILFVSVMLNGYCIADEGADLQAMAHYADTNLTEILNNIPTGEEERYGFQNRGELSQATLGIPYQEYDIDKEEPTGYWRIPVTVDGENRALLRLKDSAEGWVFAGLGGADLARNLDDHEANMDSQGRTPSTGRIVRDFTMRCDYVQFDQQQNATLSGTVYPLWSASRFISTFGTNGSATAANYSGYDLKAIKEMRLKAQQARGVENSLDNSGWGSSK